jgi:hypothetical protein
VTFLYGKWPVPNNAGNLYGHWFALWLGLQNGTRDPNTSTSLLQPVLAHDFTYAAGSYMPFYSIASWWVWVCQFAGSCSHLEAGICRVMQPVDLQGDAATQQEG